jgi:hypothetical protein
VLEEIFGQTIAETIDVAGIDRVDIRRRSQGRCVIHFFPAEVDRRTGLKPTFGVIAAAQETSDSTNNS